MGVALELIQGVSGHRTMDAYDMAANATGVVLGWLLARTRLCAALTEFEAWMGVGRHRDFEFDGHSDGLAAVRLVTTLRPGMISLRPEKRCPLGVVSLRSPIKNLVYRAFPSDPEKITAYRVIIDNICKKSKKKEEPIC
jgi:hypothetical protein